MNRENQPAILVGHSTGNVVAIWLALSGITDVLDSSPSDRADFLWTNLVNGFI